MASSTLGGETQKLLRALAVTLTTFLGHVRGFEGTDGAPAGFSPSDFKAAANGLGAAVDKEVTFMMIACKPPAREADVREMCPKVGAAFFQLVRLVDDIPRAAGHEYLVAVRKAVCGSLVAAATLVNSLIDDKVAIEQAIMAELQFMPISGVFWEHCKTLSQIPADNRAAAALTWTSAVGSLVKDAAEELHESLESARDAAGEADGFSDDSMDELDGEIPADRVDEGRRIEKLVVAAKHACDKVGLRCIRECKQLDEERIVWLDRLVDVGRTVQAAVDDVVATLFMDEGEWKRCADAESQKLRDALASLLTLAVTFVDDTHLPWFELCRRQLGVAQEAGPVVR
ncbi:hypothetical protein H4R21_002051 [Coemansia helicoidea]|uniref:Uncharacterized protein n=1 Tax=Coemansia helicoidea TaxID=1286919 RepID=A0ACC1L8X1_9FUNG|nr:hypothetical protein H4R21_002051 [Coemansia helicoidea]